MSISQSRFAAMNAEVSEIELELAKLLDKLGPSQGEQLLDYLKQIKSPAIKLSSKKFHLNDQDMQCVGLAGDRPFLPPDFAWPQDRAGVAMRLLFQVDFARLTKAAPVTDPVDGRGFILPTEGLLTIFYSDLIFTAPPKDGRSFCINYLPQPSFDQLQKEIDGDSDYKKIFARPVWTVKPQLDGLDAPGLEENIISSIRLWVQKVNAISEGDFGRFLGCESSDMSQDREICAFASGGISYSPARAKDHHYSHLVGQSANWILLAQIAEKKSSSDQTLHCHPPAHIFISADDLRDRHFERAWLLFKK